MKDLTAESGVTSLANSDRYPMISHASERYVAASVQRPSVI
jgi:hypothetical protein